MLKKCYGLFLGLMVIAGSACVTPTHASSASIVITNIRAGSQTSALEEGVVIYNNSSYEADVTNWCLTNKSSVKFACFVPLLQNEAYIIPAYGYAVAVSTLAIKNNNQNNFSLVYPVTNSSSGSIIASSDTISLVNGDNQVIDQFSWSSSISSSQQWVRTKLSILPDLFVDTNTAIDWQKVTFSEFPLTQLQHRDTTPILPPQDIPEEPVNEDPPAVTPADTTPEQPENSFVELPIIITELLPNAIGSDEGNEFIELYNPNQQAEISITGYKLAVGPMFEKVLTLPAYVLKAGEYKTFTNTQLNYSLLNSSSRVSLSKPNGELVSEVPAYTVPLEGEAWALIDGTIWQYTNQPTPGFPNKASASSPDEEEAGETVETPAATSSLKPCAANQYRSPETNRCRLIVSTASTEPVACKEGQERNPATNRCRAIETSTATTCKEGQERNPETNRCRTIKKLTTTNFGVKGATTKQQGGVGWYMWAAIGGVVLLIISYGVWEWRQELSKALQTIKAKFAGRVN